MIRAILRYVVLTTALLGLISLTSYTTYLNVPPKHVPILIDNTTEFEKAQFIAVYSNGSRLQCNSIEESNNLPASNGGYPMAYAIEIYYNSGDGAHGHNEITLDFGKYWYTFDIRLPMYSAHQIKVTRHWYGEFTIPDPEESDDF